jgi:hypothetical protein
MPTTTTGIATEFIDFTRASNATVTDSDGKVKWAPHNLLTNSESFDAASWIKDGLLAFGSGSSANAIGAPNATTTADLITPDTAGTVHRIYMASTVTVPTATPHTHGVFVKPNGYTKVAIRENAATGDYAAFELTGAGSVLDKTVGATASVSALSNGWYYIAATFSSATTAITLGVYVLSPSYTTGSITGPWVPNGTSGIYLWGASLYRSDLAMQPNTSAYPMYNPTTPKNLLGYTEDVSNGYWTNVDTADVTTGITNPRGLSGATLVYPTSSGTDRIIFRGSPVGGTVSTPYTLSVYAKANGINFLYFGTFGGGTAPTSLLTFFDLQNGTKTQTGSYFTSASITPVGDGWYRCTATANATLAGAYPTFGLANANNSSTVTASGTSGIYLWGAQLSDSASLDPYVPVYGAAVTSAAYYGPRRDFDPVTLACKGLLVEEQRTNFLLYSAAFDQSPWTSQAFNAGSVLPTVAANTVIAPDGTQTADTISFGSVPSGTINRRIQTSSQASGTNTFTGSVWLKLPSGTATVYLWFDDGTSGASVSDALISLTTTWRRFSITATVSPSQPGNMRFSIAQKDGSTLTAFDVHAWGAQLELGSFATSYIPVGSTSSGATRLADVASVSTQAFPYSQSAGSLIVNLASLSSAVTSGNFAVLAAGDSANDRIALSRTSASQSLFRVATGGSTQFSLNNTIGSGAVKIGAAFTNGDFASVADGGAAQTTSTGTLPTNIDKLHIGKYPTASGDLNGHIRQITYLPRRISNTDLQTRTA